MRTLRILGAAAGAVMAVAGAWTAAVGSVSATASRAISIPASVVVPASDKSVTYFGRWDRTDPSVAHSHWGGAYLRARFTGASIGLKMDDAQELVVSIDGEPFRSVSGQPGVTPLGDGSIRSGLHTLLVGPSSGGEAKIRGLALDAGASIKPPMARPIIEFTGDSITWGTGPKGMWNVNWAWRTAEALGCDHTQVAQAGRSLTTNYGCADEKTGMDRQYFRLKNFGYAKDDPPILWDFSTYTPQIVVINLGQNDACGNEPDDVFTASYLAFVKNIRAKFPKAEIVALRMFGGGHYGEDTRKAVAVLNASGDAHVHFIDTQGWLDRTDFYDGVHPNDVGNLKAARRLAPLLKPLIAGKAVAAIHSATVGNPKNPRALAQEIQNAYIRGDRTIVITPGTYLLPRKGAPQIELDNWRDTVIEGKNVTLILDRPSDADRLFMLSNCSHVTLEGMLLSQTTQNAYQGRVTAIGLDSAGIPTCDWRPSAGYPVPPAGLKELWINMVDAKTRTINIHAGDYYHAGLEPKGGGLFRFHLEKRPVRFQVGDWIVARYGSPPNKIFLAGCRDCVVQDITMMRNGFAPIFEGEGGGNHYLRCHWAIGPRPAGAVEDAVVTNAADGIHSPDDSPGPDIENCTFEGVFLDDCIAIHGGFHKVLGAGASTLTAKNDYAFYTVGEPVRISNDKGFYLQANVTALKDNGDGSSTLTLDSAETVPLDAYVSNPLHDGHGYKIIGCKLGNTRSRGIIVKADDGLMRGNVVSHCGMGVRIGPEWSSEADYCHNVVMEGNTLIENGDGLVVDGSGAKQNRGVVVQNNRFVGNTGHDVDIAWADGVTISGNSFTAPSPASAGSKPNPAIFVRDAQNVRIGGNRIETPGSYARPFVSIGANAAHVH